MPLTKIGKEILRNMRGEYGIAKGSSVFYAMAHTHPTWHKKKR